jgi:hypothetical protein
MSYHAFVSEDGTRYGSFEVFFAERGEICTAMDDPHPMEGEDNEPCDSCGFRHDLSDPGFYWWACFPGCLPDGEPSGPYQTEEEAIEDANSR